MNFANKALMLFTLLAAVLIGAGCCGQGMTSTAQQRYWWDFFNETPDRMHEVSVTYLHNGEQHSVTAGSLMSGIADKPPLYRNQPPPYSLKRVVCSPKSDPPAMRVSSARWAREILDEGQEAQAGAGDRQAA